MLATAPTRQIATASAVCTDDRHPLPRSLTVSGRVCSVPTLACSITGRTLAHFLLDCDALPDPRLRVLAHPGTSIIDVTVEQTDAVFVADTASSYHLRYRLVHEARKALPENRRDDAAVWDITAPFTPLIRNGVRVAVDGTPRRGWWHPIGQRDPLPFGLVADGLPRRIAAAGAVPTPRPSVARY